jgi:hypothetical protein
MAKTQTKTDAGDDELGELELLPEVPPEPSTIPELAAFRANPTRETHLAAGQLLAKTGPLVLNGELYSIVDRRVVISTPKPDKQSVVVPDDPREVLA